VPWAEQKSFEQGFGFGKNVVGFLPGTDPLLKNQIVLLCAHYDHLGKNRSGRICPGAADNASGVAALLEVARRMKSAQRPKRSVIFAAFDCEEMMLFGSFAFCCQEEERLTNLVAIVNVDMLGRDFLDVVHHTVFVSGSEQYPLLRAHLRRTGESTGIRVLPLGTDLVGPRGDHVAFESRRIPCLFFSCGSFRDYHQPEDTVKRLNCEDIARCARVITDTIRQFVDSPVLESPTTGEQGYMDELATVRTVLTEVNLDRAKAGIKAQDSEAFNRLAGEAEDLAASGRYDSEARRRLILDAGGILAPYFLPTDLAAESQSEGQQEMTRLTLQYLQELYFDYKDNVMAGYRKLVAQLLKYRPGVIRGMPKFSYELYDIPDRDIAITRRSPDKHSVDALATSFTIVAQVKPSKWLIKSFSGYIGGSVDILSCEGTQEQLEDFCLLRLRDERSNALHSVAVKKILKRVTETQPKFDYSNLLAETLGRRGLKDENAWLVKCLEEGTPELVIEAIEATRHNSDPRIADAVSGVITNPAVRADVRAAAIQRTSETRSRVLACALCSVLEDHAVAYRREFLAMARDDYPFTDRMAVRAALRAYDRQLKRHPSKTIGELAHAQLQNLTKRDLGKDPKVWRNWIDAHPVFAER
jgi:hypothetical protein